MENVVDSLQIDIVSTQTEASKSLDAVVSSLKKLDRISKSNSFNLLRKQLKGLAGVSFDKLQRQLNSITKNIKTLKSYKDFMNNLSLGNPTIDTSGITAGVNAAVSEVNRAAEEVVNVGESFGESVNTRPEWLDDMQSQCDTIVDSFGTSAETINATKDRILTMLGEKAESYGSESAFIGATDFTDTLADKLQKLSIQANLLKEKMASMVESGNVDSTQWQKLQKELIQTKLQYEQLEQAANRHARAVDSLGETVKKTKKPLGKLISNFARVGMYRMIRFVLSQIMQAVTEGIQNLARFSNEANEVMSAYKTEFTYIKNSLGTALMPILQAMMPIVIRLGDAFADVANSIGMIGAAINGDDTFLKATKYAQNYKKSLDEIKKATVSFDEINVLSKVDTNGNYKEMFEEVELSGWDVAGAVTKLGLLTAAITTLVLTMKGVNIKTLFTNLSSGIKKVGNSLKNMSSWKKGTLAVTGLIVEAVSCYNAFKDLGTGSISLGNALTQTIPIIVAVGYAMNSMFGVVGIVLAAVVALTSAIVGVASAQIDMMHEASMAEFFTMEGIAIDQVTASMNNYFRSIGLEKQQAMNEKLTEATEDLIDARLAYDSLWTTIKDADSLSTTQIEKLSQAFTDLANATNAFNSAAIESAMASLRTGIELNITPELTARLESLVGSLQAAQDLIGIKVSGLNSEYQQILNDVASGKMSTAEAMPKLEELRNKMNDFTLSDNTSSAAWNTSMQEAIEKGINAGTNEEAIKENITNLTKERDAYLKTIKDSYNASVGVLTQLIEIDKTQFGGALGFKDSDLDVLKENYDAQVNAVHSQYNAVLDSIINSFSSKALDYDKYVTDYGGEGFMGFLDTVGAGIGGLFGWLGVRDGNGDTGWEHNANKQTAIDQKAFIDWLKSLKGYASGGFPEDDSFIYVNPNEIIGKMSNGKTVVANNMQIIEGIKQGVIEAMNESGNNNGGDWIIQIVDADGGVKGEAIIAAAERKNRRDGKTVISVGG